MSGINFTVVVAPDRAPHGNLTGKLLAENPGKSQFPPA